MENASATYSWRGKRRERGMGILSGGGEELELIGAIIV